MATVRPLPRSLDPLPDESLLGYLLRLSYRLDFPLAPLTVVTRLAKRGSNDWPYARLAQATHLDPATLDVFAQATRLTPTEAAGLCLSPLAERYPPAAPKDPRHARRSDGGVAWLVPPHRWLFATSTRYCPRCLAGDGSAIQRAYGGAWKKSWRLPVVVMCLTHHRLLEHECPACHQPANSTPSAGGGGLRATLTLTRAHGPILHPAQCRNTSRPEPWRVAVCGARLDAAASTSAARRLPASVLDFQQRVAALLAPDGPTRTASAGQPTTVARYFTDLRLLVSLLCASWPQARRLTPSARFAVAVDRHVAWQHTLVDRLGGRPSGGVFPIFDTPPADPVACAGLLVIADEILRAGDPRAVGERVRPLLAFEDRPAQKTWWGKRFLGAMSNIKAAQRGQECSPGLWQAVAPLLQTQHHELPPRRPQTRYGPEHIPQALQDDWYDRHLHHLHPTREIRPVRLRRIAAARLVQLTTGWTLNEAADFLDITPKRVHEVAQLIHALERTRPDPHAFKDALERLAAELDTAAPSLVNYRRRREALKGWCIDAATWQQLISRLPRTYRNKPPDLGDRKRQAASVLVWARVTQGEHYYAPRPIQDAQPQDLQRAWRTWHANTMPLFRNPGRRHYAELTQLLDAYADELAARVDAGWRPVDSAN